jgi:hypothetical protein
MRGGGGGAGSPPMITGVLGVQCAHGAQINFGDLIPYSTYELNRNRWSQVVGEPDQN